MQIDSINICLVIHNWSKRDAPLMLLATSCLQTVHIDVPELSVNLNADSP